MCWKEMDKMLIKNTKRMDGKKGVELRKKALKNIYIKYV